MKKVTRKMQKRIKETKIDRANNDVNGNPRYVIHYLDVADTYAEAINKIKIRGNKMNYTDAKKRLTQLEPSKTKTAAFTRACKALKKEISKQKRSKKPYKISDKFILGKTRLSDIFGKKYKSKPAIYIEGNYNASCQEVKGNCDASYQKINGDCDFGSI